MMKKNLVGDLLDIHGKGVTEDGKGVTLQSIIVAGLLSPRQGDSAEEKLNDFKLAQRVQLAKEAEYSAEELARIKAVCAMQFTPLAVGRIYELIGDEK